MKNLTIQEAARRLNISEKTLRRWVHTHKIAARLDEGRYWFAERDITAYLQAHQPHIGEESIYEVVYARLDTIDTRLDEIQKAVERLTALMQAKETPKILKPPQPHYSAKETVPDEQVGSSLPDGLVAMTRFAQIHTKPGKKPPETTFRNDVKKGSLKAVPGHWVIGNNPVKWALSEEGRAAFYRLYHNREWFQERECCPHSS